MLVGGDWYDAFTLPCGRTAITIGDVLGHGIEAAVWMSRLRNSLRALLHADSDPAHALLIADRLMRLDSPNDFSTALVAIVDPKQQTLSCASAGHPGPLLWQANSGVGEPFVEHGLPLGLRDFDTRAKPPQTVQLQAGTFVAFFTDGLLEWNRDIAGAWESIQGAISDTRVRHSTRPARALFNAVIGENEHQDDVAILTLCVED